MAKIAIIGGGPAGLGAAKKLVEAGQQVTVFEASDELGGLARSFEKDGFRIPIFYHHILQFDSTTRALMGEFGLMDNLARKTIKMGISFDNKVYEISKIKTLFWDFLSLGDKWKFAFLYLNSKIKKDWSDLEGVNAHDWLGKTVGETVRDRIFAPLMWVKYGIPLAMISASELATRIGNEEATGELIYPKEGLYELYKRLGDYLETRGVTIKFNSPVTKINIKEGRAGAVFCKAVNGTAVENFDYVINTSPLPVFLRAVDGLPQDFMAQLEQIKYCAGICLTVGFEEPVSKYYWTNVFDKPFGITVEHTNLCDIYPWKACWISRYAPPAEHWAMDDEQITKLFLDGLKKIHPHAKVKWVKVSRTAYASPVYDINYQKYMPEIETPIPNLFFAGIAITYPKLRSQNTAFESGFEAAQKVLQKISSA